MQWLTKGKVQDFGRCIQQVKKLEDLLRSDVQRYNGFVSLVSLVPMTQLSQKQELHAHRDGRLGVPLGSTYPTDGDLLRSCSSMWEAKVMW